MPVGLSVEVIGLEKVPSRYYRVPRYFFTVLSLPWRTIGGTAPHYTRLHCARIAAVMLQS